MYSIVPLKHTVSIQSFDYNLRVFPEISPVKTLYSGTPQNDSLVTYTLSREILQKLRFAHVSDSLASGTMNAG